MFSTVPMQKIRIVGLQNHKERIIRALHKMGAIDIRRSELEIEDDDPGVALPTISELVVRYHSANVILQKHLDKEKPNIVHAREQHGTIKKLIKRARGFRPVKEVLSLEENRMRLGNEIEGLDAAIKLASLFVGTGIDFSQLKSDVLDFAAYTLDRKSATEAMKELHHLSERYEMIEKKTKTGSILFLAYKKDDAKILEKIEKLHNVHKMDIKSSYLDSTAEKSLEKLAELKKKALRETAETLEQLDRHGKENYSTIRAILEMLEVEEERAEVSLSFKKTQSSFIVEGWMEKGKIDGFREHLSRLCNDKFVLEEITTKELAPTLISRPRFFKPFDFLMEFFSLPRSDELDPTWIFILTFPIFYGLMVSDVGYGLASLLFATFLARATDPEDILHNVAKVWQISSISIIFFGFLSNQYFGFGLNQYFTSFTGFDWLKNSTTILAITVVFGIMQVILGLIFGFVNNYRHGHKKVAVSKITAMVMIVFGTVAISGALFGLVGGLLTEISAAIMVVSLLVTMALSGQEAPEIVSVISHPLSYTRIMGFGLASVILALLIDKAFTPSFSSGFLGFAFTLIIFILLHFVNMLLGIFEGMVQGVRLNFVEFFSKFYTGGGVKFRPFFYKRRYTKEA